MSKVDFGFRSESRLLDEEARSHKGSSYVSLPLGVVHYELAGPDDGEVVVLVHGFSVPSYIWDAPFAALSQAGFRVLRYDLYGRGYSDRPTVRYDQSLFDQQLFDLLAALKIDGPVNLCGLSMGGLIVVVFTDRHPEKVKRLCLIDPLCSPLEWKFPRNLLMVPLLGECIMSLFGDRFLANQGGDFYHPEKFPDYASRFYPQLQYKGFKNAILSTMRYMVRKDIEAPYRRVGQQPKRPALLFWGRQDQVIPYSLSENVQEMIPYIELVTVEECGHLPQYERPEILNPILIEFLSHTEQKS